MQSVILVLGRWRQEDQQFRVILSYMKFKTSLDFMRACLNLKQNNMEMLNSVTEKVIPNSFSNLDHGTVKKVQRNRKDHFFCHQQSTLDRVVKVGSVSQWGLNVSVRRVTSPRCPSPSALSVKSLPLLLHEEVCLLKYVGVWLISLDVIILLGSP